MVLICNRYWSKWPCTTVQRTVINGIKCCIFNYQYCIRIGRSRAYLKLFHNEKSIDKYTILVDNLHKREIYVKWSTFLPILFHHLHSLLSEMFFWAEFRWKSFEENLELCLDHTTKRKRKINNFFGHGFDYLSLHLSSIF